MWWMMLMVATLKSVTSDTAPPISCEVARFRCASREGCGIALEHYMTGCSAVLQGEDIGYCPEVCMNSLIALTSTFEGKDMMSCRCSDDYCEDMKRRVEVCRPLVMMASLNTTIIKCPLAQLICASDTSCGVAFDYYEVNCKQMFQGRKCSPKCRNSLDILRRQEKAAKLQTCVCEADDQECMVAQRNMKLCLRKKKNRKDKQKPKENDKDERKGRRKDKNKKDRKKDRRKENRKNNRKDDVGAILPIEPVVRGDTNTNDITQSIPFENGSFSTQPHSMLVALLLLTSFTFL